MVLQAHLSRVWFLSKGCKQVPPDYINGKVLWAHPNGYFLSAQGKKLEHNFSPAMQRGCRSVNGHFGSRYPAMRHFGSKICHHLMAVAYYGKRPTFINPYTGKEYVGIVHHLVPDKMDYRPANLLCWLTHEQHREADRRQRELRKLFPDLHALTYDSLRQLQDPRVSTTELFEIYLNELRGTKA